MLKDFEGGCLKGHLVLGYGLVYVLLRPYKSTIRYIYFKFISIIFKLAKFGTNHSFFLTAK